MFHDVPHQELVQGYTDLFGRKPLMTTCGHCNTIVLQEFAKVSTFIVTEHIQETEHFCSDACALSWWRARSGDA